MSSSSVAVKVGAASVLLPAVGILVGLMLYAMLPGCKCDAGAGCHGCGSFDAVVSFLMFGGFVGAVGALIFILPASLVVAFILRSRGDGS